MSRRRAVHQAGFWFAIFAAGIGLGCAAPGIDFDTSPGSTRSGGRHAISIDPVIGGEEDDPVINAAAVSELFDQQALILHQRIERLRQTPAPPAP